MTDSSSDAILNSEIIKDWLRHEDDHEWWVGKDLEGGSHILFQGIILVLACRDWGNCENVAK
jgi:hypothetical protein